MRVGYRCNQLVVVAPTAPDSEARAKGLHWLCTCDCGGFISVRNADLARRRVHGCGCQNGRNLVTHGLSRHPLYRAWGQMVQRCSNPKNQAWANYGGRGIEVCAAWRDFACFLRDVGERPYAGATLERVNSDGPYAPHNVRWASRSEQQQNTRHVRRYTYNGRTQTVTDWALELGLLRSGLKKRLERGMTIEAAIATATRCG